MRTGLFSSSRITDSNSAVGMLIRVACLCCSVSTSMGLLVFLAIRFHFPRRCVICPRQHRGQAVYVLEKILGDVLPHRIENEFHPFAAGPLRGPPAINSEERRVG